MSVYFITGISGYIGSMLVKYLLENDLGCEIIAPVRNIQKAEKRLTDIGIPAKRKLPYPQNRLRLFQEDLCFDDFPECMYGKTGHVDYIIHCASATSSLQMITQPVEVTKSIVDATKNCLELARRLTIKSMVYLSSMEVYGKGDCSDGHRTSEEEAGDGGVDLLSVRSCYPLGKRMAENLCYSYFQEYGVPVKIARLAQTFGRDVPPSNNRVFSQFAHAVQAGEDIVLHTEGNSMGNYCGIDDAVSGILTILEKGENGEAYNVVNEENTMTIRQMAQLTASQVAGGRIGIRFEIPADNHYGYAADTGLKLSGEKLIRLGWKPEENLTDMYQDLLRHMKSATCTGYL